jgi:DNA polymerase III epsilon subunit-like protein
MTSTRNFFLVDTETTGFPTKYAKYHEHHKYDSARMVQIAWYVLDPDLKVLTRKNYILYPEQFKIPDSKFHFVTQEIGLTKGVKLKDIFEDLSKDIKTCDKFLAYNVEFDFGIIQSEISRLEGMEYLNCYIDKMTHVCAMKSAMYYMEIDKWPKLKDAYQEIVGSEGVKFHDALGDVEATYQVWKRIMKNEY